MDAQVQGFKFSLGKIIIDEDFLTTQWRAFKKRESVVIKPLETRKMNTI